MKPRGRAMLFKNIYRKYKADEARKKSITSEGKSVLTAPNSPTSSSGSERESQYFDFKQLNKVYAELESMTAQINQLKESIKILQRSDGDKGQIQFQASLVRAFEQERNDLSLRELSESYVPPTRNSFYL